MTLFLIDASHYQGGLPISTLREQGFVALIAKATDGTGFTDPRFQAFRAEAQQSGLPFAGYHFLHSGNLAAQAAHARSVVPTDVSLWVDIEGGPTLSDGYGFADAYRAAGGRLGGFYSGGQPKAGYGGWWRPAYLNDPTGPAAAVYAHQGGDQAAPWSAGQTRHPDIWQFCQHGRVSGYSGDVDLNAYRGTLTELAGSGWFWVPPNLDGSDMPLTTDDLNKIKALVPQPSWLERMVEAHTAAAIRDSPQIKSLTAAVSATLVAVRDLPAAAEQVDVAALAQMIATALPDDLAQELADVLAQRLAQ